VSSGWARPCSSPATACFEVAAVRYVGDGEALDAEVVLAHWPSSTDAFIGQIATGDPVRAPMRSFDLAAPAPEPGLWKRLFRRLLGLFRF
jgi:hypothetical protein